MHVILSSSLYGFQYISPPPLFHHISTLAFTRIHTTRISLERNSRLKLGITAANSGRAFHQSVEKLIGNDDFVS